MREASPHPSLELCLPPSCSFQISPSPQTLNPLLKGRGAEAEGGGRITTGAEL